MKKLFSQIMSDKGVDLGNVNDFELYSDSCKDKCFINALLHNDNYDLVNNPYNLYHWIMCNWDIHKISQSEIDAELKGDFKSYYEKLKHDDWVVVDTDGAAWEFHNFINQQDLNDTNGIVLKSYLGLLYQDKANMFLTK